MKNFKIINAGKYKSTTSIKVLLYGESGAGKSYLSVTAPKPLVLLTEMNGQASIMHSNPNSDIIHVSSDILLGDVLKDIESNPDNWKKYDTIVIDSLTEVQRLIKDRITNRGSKQMRLQDWGLLADTMRRLMSRIRALQKSVVCICLLEAQIDEETGTRHYKPAFEGKKTSGEIAQYFNAVGFLYTAQQQTKEGDDLVTTTARHLMVEGPSRILCKPTYPLNGTIENPNLTKIFKQIREGK